MTIDKRMLYKTAQMTITLRERDSGAVIVNAGEFVGVTFNPTTERYSIVTTDGLEADNIEPSWLDRFVL